MNTYGKLPAHPLTQGLGTVEESGWRTFFLRVMNLTHILMGCPEHRTSTEQGMRNVWGMKQLGSLSIFTGHTLGQTQWRDQDMRGSYLGENLSKATRPWFKGNLASCHCFFRGHTRLRNIDIAQQIFVTQMKEQHPQFTHTHTHKLEMEVDGGDIAPTTHLPCANLLTCIV